MGIFKNRNTESKIEELTHEIQRLNNELKQSSDNAQAWKDKYDDIEKNWVKQQNRIVILKNGQVRQFETHVVTLVKILSSILEISEDEVQSKYIPEFRRFLTSADETETGGLFEPNAKKRTGSNFDIIEGIPLDKGNKEFYHAAEYVKSGKPLIYLTGKAGTGKSTFLKYIKQSQDKNIVILAPTGVAAMNVGGQTIHSFFRLPLSIFIPGDSRFRPSAPPDDPDQNTIKNHFNYRRETIEMIRNMEILIIDEISMVRCDILDAVDRLLRHFRRDDIAFGGVQTILIGDAFQLAPIAKDDEWDILKEFYKTPYFFSSNVLSETRLEYVELNKIYRQSDLDFINLLNRVRIGDVTNEDIALLNSKCNPDFEPGSEEGYIILTTHNSFVRDYNNSRLNNLPGKSKCYEAVISGSFPEKLIPAETELLLKVGAQVMFLKNDKNKEQRYYNGKIGTIKELQDEYIVVVCSNGNEIDVTRDIWDYNTYTWNKNENKITSNTKGSFIQFPLKLAWAITVHKSQGLGFDKVIADLSDAFAPGQVYVALSRCTSSEGLVLKTYINKNAIKTDERVVEFEKSNSM